uniref:MobP2 family relaxase n=1 Tax=[Ruminococcus] torques TaxID=33039 RepID=UPI00402A878B
KHLKKVFSIAQTNQSLMWQTVISFDNNWLQKNGIYDMKTKMLDERKLKAVTRKAINELLKNEGLDQAVWSASIHYNTDNIHVHIATVEPYPMRKKMMYQGKEEVRGKFKLSNINHCKSVVINEIVQTREMNLRINTIIRKDIVGKLKEEELTKDSEIKSKFLELCQNLPEIPKNRMNYGNKEMRQYRAMIDEISEKFLEVYSSEKYYELREILDRQSLLYTEAYGGDQGGDYKKNKLQELKEKMGNAVLKQAKDYIECMNNKVDEPNFGMKEKTNEEISIELAVLEETEDAFLINEQEQLFEEKENIEQVDETQEKEYDLRLSAKSRIDISEVLQKELEAAKTYLGGESSVNTLPQDDSREYSEDLMKYYIKSKELKRLLKQALKEKEATEKQRQIFNFIQNEAEKKNNPFVKELLGEMYIYGNLVEVDLEKAREYFSEALEIFEQEYDSLEDMQRSFQEENKKRRFNLKNHIAFCIGKQYDRGWGVEETPELALEWYKDSRTGYANYAIGQLYYNGRGVEKDNKMAFAFFQKAEENAFAELMCAKMLEKGEGVEKNIEKSLECYSRAFDLFLEAEERENSALFEYHIGRMLYYGKGCESNEEKAVEYLRKAVEEKNVPAILLLSNIYYEKGVVKEIPYMIEHLKELSDKADHIQAQYTLGKIYLKEGEFYNLEKGISYLERSASQGNEYAKYRLAKEYLNIDSKAYDPKKGISYLNELAEGGYEWAQLKMGCEYIKGEHVERNYFQAMKWLEKAVDQGNVYAEEILNDLNVRIRDMNRYGAQKGIRNNALGELDKAMVALRKSLYETQKEMRYNMMVYEQDIRAEIDGYVLEERRGLT